VEKLSYLTTIIPCIIGGQGREGLFRNFINSISKYRIAVYPGKCSHKISIVHVDDVVSLIFTVVQKSIFGKFNVAASDALSISDWIEIISNHVNHKFIFKISIPLWIIKLFSRFTFYRFLAFEQVLMLEMPHVISIEESLNLGWIPFKSSKTIIKDITSYILK